MNLNAFLDIRKVRLLSVQSMIAMKELIIPGTTSLPRSPMDSALSTTPSRPPDDQAIFGRRSEVQG
jgi:hypothetical protein